MHWVLFISSSNHSSLAHHRDSQPEDATGQEGWDFVSLSFAFQEAVASCLLGAVLSDRQVKGGRWA